MCQPRSTPPGLRSSAAAFPERSADFLAAHYSAPKLFTLNGASVAVSYGQISGSPIHIKQIVIDGPKLVVEQNNGKLNIQALMDQLPKSPDRPPRHPSLPNR